MRGKGESGMGGGRGGQEWEENMKEQDGQVGGGQEDQP